MECIYLFVDFFEKGVDVSLQPKKFTMVDEKPIITLHDNKSDAPMISAFAKNKMKKGEIKNQKKKTKKKDQFLVKTKNACLSKITKKGKEKTIEKKKKKTNNRKPSSSNDTKGKIKADVQSVPRGLRPIVIDAHNVAMCHGKMSDNISIKGIKICVDYFLKRGHTLVTALLPKFPSLPSKNHQLLEELALKQHVVYTPFRDGKGTRNTFNNEKLIVQLALETGGVIVSNNRNQWRSLTGISQEFRKVIKERILPYLFVGDVFMVPDDPISRDGPRLAEVLSFPSSMGVNIPDFDGETCTSNDVIFGTINGQQAHAAKDFCEKKIDASQQPKNFMVVDDVPIITQDDDDDKSDAPLISFLAKKNWEKGEIKNQKKKDPYIVKTKNPRLSKITKTGKEKTLGKKKNKNPCSTSSSSNDTKLQEQMKSRSLSSNTHALSVPRPIPSAVKVLRPIVIDGSNVARQHRRGSNTFSCKGLQICVDYFLKRGHTQVTAFVPHNRRNCRKSITPDQGILDKLALKQHVVFTPDQSYDDRFVLQLALENGGVIVSNDLYRDLSKESAAFKEVAEKRLLKYSFRGDTFMIPEYPLGRNGPSLEDFLSFPSEASPQRKSETDCISLE